MISSWVLLKELGYVIERVRVFHGTRCGFRFAHISLGWTQVDNFRFAVRGNVHFLWARASLSVKEALAQDVLPCSGLRETGNPRVIVVCKCCVVYRVNASSRDTAGCVGLKGPYHNRRSCKFPRLLKSSVTCGARKRCYFTDGALEVYRCT